VSASRSGRCSARTMAPRVASGALLISPPDMPKRNFHVRPYDGDLGRDFIATAASFLAGGERGPARTGSEARLVGPFPVYSASAQRLLETPHLSRAARLRGWRALVVVNEEPRAVVDAASVRGRTGAILRGKEPASALHGALQYCELLSAGWEGGSAPELRILEVPGAFLTTLWIAKRPPVFVPTRLSSAERPPPGQLTLAELLAAVSIAVRRRRPAISERAMKRPGKRRTK